MLLRLILMITMALTITLLSMIPLTTELPVVILIMIKPVMKMVLAPRTSCKYRNEKLIVNHTKTSTKKQTNKESNKQKLVERNYLAAVMHIRFRNYLLSVRWIALTPTRWQISNYIFKECHWKTVQLKSCCVSMYKFFFWIKSHN